MVIGPATGDDSQSPRKLTLLGVAWRTWLVPVTRRAGLKCRHPGRSRTDSKESRPPDCRSQGCRSPPRRWRGDAKRPPTERGWRSL